MDSGLYTKVFTSTEVIVASLFLILLLPLVFFIASTKSRRTFVRPPGIARTGKRARATGRRAPAPRPAAAPAEDTPAEDTPGPRRRAPGPEEDTDPDADEGR